MHRLAIAGMLVGLTLSGSAAASRNTPEWERLDYARTIAEDGIVFVPFKGTSRGVFWYREYEQSVTEPRKFLEAERIFVSLKPKAHQDGRYERFLRDHGVSDARAVWLEDAASACSTTAELEEIVAPSGHRTSVLGPAYPSLCTVSIIYAPNQRSAVQTLITNESAITAQTTVPLCAKESLTYDAQAVVAALVQRGVIKKGAAQSMYTGGAFAILQAVTDIFRDGTSVQLQGIPADGASHFMKTFVQYPGRVFAATVDVAPLLGPVYVCKPATLEIEFGRGAAAALD